MHTPRPWQIETVMFNERGIRDERHGKFEEAWIVDANKMPIAKVFTRVGDNDDGAEKAANARLIEASAELFESLAESAMLLLGIHLGEVQPDDMGIRYAAERSLALIAKTKQEDL